VKKVLIITLVFISSCSYFNKKKSERVLARAYNEYLYESDLAGVVPPGSSSSDSTSLARNFIDTWIRQKLIIHQAENNLTSQQMDFAQQLENYKNSLIIFEYENELVKQKLDTIVSDEEIEAYYTANQQNFLLKENIIQIRYVKLPKNSPNINQIKKLLASDDSEQKTKLSELAEKYSDDYFLDDQNWLIFNNVMNQIPIKTYNQEEFLRNHREVEVQDSVYHYIVRFKDFKIKESISPLSFEKDRIKNIILNKRKIDLINKMHQDIYEQSVKKNDFEVY